MAARAPRSGSRLLLLAPPGAPRDRLQEVLELGQHAVEAAPTPVEALKVLEGDGSERPRAVIVSQELGGPAVTELIRRGALLHVPVLVLGAATSSLALDAVCDGAADFVAAPAEARVVLRRLNSVLLRQAGGSGAAVHAHTPQALADALGLIGRSRALLALMEKVQRIARYKTNVLLLGESGTGKELVARALHALGPHRQHLFVPLNCAALGRDIIENELFGHERGAFTGANERKKGLFELADGGTLFLDEIGEMELSTQSKLLRVLERNEFRRVGGSGKIKVDVSVIAATNRDLEQAVSDGRFRDDLYYRLKIVTLVVPPLRERREDIPLLVTHFLEDFNRRNGARLDGIAPKALELLVGHDWPGNVRELKHAVESAAILAAGRTITVADVDPAIVPSRRRAPPPRTVGRERPAPLAIVDRSALQVPLGLPLREIERRVIEATLLRCRTKAEAARALGIGLRTLYTKLREYQPAPLPASPRSRARA